MIGLLIVLAGCETQPSKDTASAPSPNTLPVFSESFESETFHSRFQMDRGNENVRIADSNEVLQGRYLEVTIPKGMHVGANFSYIFKTQLGEEPEALYARYYLRLGKNWVNGKGGKLPGPLGHIWPRRMGRTGQQRHQWLVGSDGFQGSRGHDTDLLHLPRGHTSKLRTKLLLG